MKIYIQYAKNIVMVIFVVGVSCIILYGMKILHRSQKISVLSSYEAMRGVLRMSNNIDIMKNISVGFDNHWRLLSEQEYEVIAKVIGKDYFIDANENDWKPDKILVDRWGNRLFIGARRDPLGGLEWMIWSKGPDGRLDTKDDLISTDDVNSYDEIHGLVKK